MRNALALFICFALTLPCYAFMRVSKCGEFDERIMFDTFDDLNCESYLARMDNAINYLKNKPDHKMAVYVYDGKLARYTRQKDGNFSVTLRLPQFGLAKARIDSMDKYIARKKGPRNQFIFIEAGYGQRFEVQMYVLPPSVEPPKFGPTIVKPRYRKGRPKGFCLDCC